MVFGLLIDWVSSNYHQQIWRGVHEACQARGVNLVTLVTGRPGSPFRWELMRNQLLAFVDGQGFDGFLFLTATLGDHLGPDQFRSLLDRAAPAPVVALGAELDGIPSVAIHNSPGFTALLDHLHRVHGLKRFAFAGGPPLNADARERRRLFETFLVERGLEVRPDRIVEGDFSSVWGHRAVDRLIPGDRPDFEALVCANDDIAMGAVEALAARGIEVPEDLAVTGFDDVVTSGPAGLTTARQLLVELGRRGVALLWDRIHGRQVPLTTLTTTELVVRQSCGCLSPAARAAAEATTLPLTTRFTEVVTTNRDLVIQELSAEGLPPLAASEFLGAFLEAWTTGRTEAFFRRLRGLLRSAASPNDLHYPLSVLGSWVRRCPEGPQRRDAAESLIHRARIAVSEAIHVRAVAQETQQRLVKDSLSDLAERLLDARDFEGQAGVLLSIFGPLGIRTFRLALYEDSNAPTRAARLVLTEQGVVPEGGRIYRPLDLFPPGFEPATQPWSLVAEALFDQSAPLGFFLLDPHGDPAMLSVFDQLCERVGRGLETVRRIQNLEVQVAQRTEALRLALENLEAHNRQLKELALRDELTGLYNRRGFLTLAEHHWRSLGRHGAESTLFYGDLDGLKTVNDTWGHEAGDEAIRAAGRTLVETFRSQDVVARLGGDEFVVLAPGCSRVDAAHLAERLADRVAAVAEGRWGFSLGWIVLGPDTDRSLADGMREADEALYRVKEAKRARRSPGTA